MSGGAGQFPPLRLAGVSWGHGGRALGAGLELVLEAGAALAVVGPNGAGKTTLLRTVAGLAPTLDGEVLLGGAALAALSATARARRVSILPQEPVEDEALTVRELVELGRTPHLGLFGGLSAADHAAVDRALAVCDLASLAGRRLDRLSGGERQRARLALAVAQGAPLLLLDEPATHLDLRRRRELYQQLRRLRAEAGLALVLALHDLADAYREAERVLVVADGRAALVADDDPARRAKLAAAFAVPEEHIIL